MSGWITFAAVSLIVLPNKQTSFRRVKPHFRINMFTARYWEHIVLHIRFCDLKRHGEQSCSYPLWIIQQWYPCSFTCYFRARGWTGTVTCELGFLVPVCVRVFCFSAMELDELSVAFVSRRLIDVCLFYLGEQRTGVWIEKHIQPWFHRQRCRNPYSKYLNFVCLTNREKVILYC